MIKRHLQGVLNAIAARITNARLEGLNATIQWAQALSPWLPQPRTLRNVIYFHLGGPDLYPDSVLHPNS